LNRLAYRELGTCLGIATTSEVDAELLDLADKIRSTWGESGSIPGPNMTVAGRLMKSLPINSVMYATALFPGGEPSIPQKLIRSIRICKEHGH